MTRYSIHCIVLACLTLTLGACNRGPQPVPAAAVSGKVTLDGEPLKEGVITFYPDTDAAGKPLEGQMAQTRITDGSYAIANPPGVTVGKNRVTISSTKVVGKEKKDGVDVEKREEILPGKYNAETTLSLEVSVPQTLGNFDLQSK